MNPETSTPTSDGEFDSEDFGDDEYTENYQLPNSARSFDRNTQELIEVYNKDLTHKPELNLVSLEIASRLPHTSKERLFMPKSTSPRVDDNLYPFKPALNKRSVELVSGKKFDSFEERINELYKKTSKTQQKIEEKKKEFMEKELEGCTFTPNVSKTVNRFNLKGKTVSDRAAIWELRRKQKIMKGKRDVDEKELEGCTFSPYTQRLKINSPKENRGDPLGYDEFLHRQKAAREKKNELEKVFQSGNRWKNQITIPKEFSFGSKEGIKIKALQKPVTNEQANRKTNYFNSTMDQSKEPTMILDDGALEFDEDEELVTQLSTPERNNSMNSTFSAPPQGLFSSKTTVSILDSLQEAEALQSSPSKSVAKMRMQRQFPQMEPISPSKEWIRRSKQKEEETVKYL